MTFDPQIIAAATAVAGIVLGAGIFIGRRSGKPAERIRDLDAQLESAAKDRELARASLDAARAEITHLKTERDQYRGEVVEHFTGASDLLRDLTVQYRAVYDHLTQGATGLCPPGSVGLQEGLSGEQLAPGSQSETTPDEKVESAA